MTDSTSGRSGSVQRWFIILCLVALVAIQAFGAVIPQRWEYTVESPADDKLIERMDALGALGWEVVSARRATSSDGPASYEMILKRPK